MSFREIHVWRRHQIAEIVNGFAGLALVIKGSQGTRLRSVDAWSRLDEMSVPFIPGPEQSEILKRLQEALRNETDRTPISVLGEPGIGKTRLVLEAVRTEPDLSALTVYAEEPDHLFSDASASSPLIKSHRRA